MKYICIVLLCMHLSCAKSNKNVNPLHPPLTVKKEVEPERTYLVTEAENLEMPVYANYNNDLPADKLTINTRYIGDEFLTKGISIDRSGVVLNDGITDMVINTKDLELRGLYRHITGGGPHMWLAKSFSKAIFPWSVKDHSLVMNMRAVVRVVELEDRMGNMGQANFTADQAPVTQLSFGFYLKDIKSNTTFAYIVPAYESRGSYKESANNNDTFVNFISTPLESKSTYITKAPSSSSLQSKPYTDFKSFEMYIKPENLKKAITDSNNKNLSKELSDYQLTMVGVLFELPNYVKDGHNTTRINVSHFTAYTGIYK